MLIGVVQIKAYLGDMARSMAAHLGWTKRSIAHGAQLVVFPELSLSGYVTLTAHQTALPLQTPALDGFQALSDRHEVVVAVGMPLRTANGVKIGMVVFTPHAPRQAYAKQYLHTDETAYFEAGDTHLHCSIGGVRMAPAICYESLLPVHCDSAHQHGLDLYLCAVAKPFAGLAKARAYYPKIARQYQTVVAMANGVGPCEGFTCAGGTAVWNANGHCVAQLDAHSEGLLIYNMATCLAQPIFAPHNMV